MQFTLKLNAWMTKLNFFWLMSNEDPDMFYFLHELISTISDERTDKLNALFQGLWCMLPYAYLTWLQTIHKLHLWEISCYLPLQNCLPFSMPQFCLT